MPLDQLQDIIGTFNSVEREIRLEILLDFSRKLPPLPDRYQKAVDQGINRVPECMTPVFLFIEPDQETDQIRLHFAVAEEAPTVKGLLGIIVEACDGQTLADLEAIPTDLVDQLGLGDMIRMQRAVGLAGIINRIKRQASLASAKQ